VADYEPLDNLFPERKRHTGAIAPLSAIVANFQVWDALRILGGIGEPIITNRTGEIDLRTLSIHWSYIQTDKQCDLCGRPADIKRESMGGESNG